MDIGTYATKSAFSMHPGLVETREQSLLGTLAMHEKWHGKANDRIRKYSTFICLPPCDLFLIVHPCQMSGSVPVLPVVSVLICSRR
jgi:hypothetical protein